MNREDIEKLLGGYATGTLTKEEQQALFEAALDDQELFDALAREQALRDLLRDPAARDRLLAALDGARSRWWGGALWGALWARWWRPVAVAAAMAGVAAFGVFLARQNVRAPQPMTVAQVRPPAIPPAELGPAPAPPRAQPRKAKVVAPAAEAPAVAVALQRAESDTRSAAETRPFGVAGGAVGGVLAAPVAQEKAAPVRLQDAASNLVAPAALPAPVSAAPFGVHYSVLRKLAGGEFAEMDPDQALETGDIIELRFESNDSGYLYVMGSGGSRLVASSFVERLKPYTTPPLESGEKEFQVVFARQPQTTPASGQPASQQVSFTITLKYK
jgi:hypothetical protein